MSKVAPGGNKLIKRTAKKQKKVGSNLIKAAKFLNKAGKDLHNIYSLKINYTKKNKTKRRRH
tara:strand:- start:617 stop:802 length:186 start_codon:yes stop_codon:yes gene_type:complete